MDSNDLKANFFNVHLCHVCKSKDSFSHSKLCSACKLISYCSSEHQKADRTNHKFFCQAVQHVCHIVGGDDVFDAAILSLLRRREMKVMISKCSQPEFPPKSERTKVKIMASQIIENYLSQTLKRFEMNMIFFPKHCTICFSRKNIMKELVCTNCFSVAYCSVEHQHLDKHEEVCSEFRKVLDMDLFMLNVNLESPGVPLIKPNQAANIKLDVYEMKTFIAKYIKSRVKFEVEALISIYYTSVLTFAYVVNRIPNFKLDKRLIVHIVGAHVAHEARVVKYWENLLHLFPHVHAATIVHIGPLIDGSSTKLKLCIDCNNAEKSVEILFYKQHYHEYLQSSCVMKKPHVIIAFNSGLYDHEPGYDPWGPSLPLFFKYNNVPIILTEGFEWEIEKDLERLLSSNVTHDKNVCVAVKCEKNPFLNLRPWRDWNDPDFTVHNKDSYVCALVVENGRKVKFARLLFIGCIFLVVNYLIFQWSQQNLLKGSILDIIFPMNLTF